MWHSKEPAPMPVGDRLAAAISSCHWVVFLRTQNIIDYWESGDIKFLLRTICQAVS